MYESEFSSAFYRYYALFYYEMASIHDRKFLVKDVEADESLRWLFMNEYRVWERMADEAFARGE